MKLKGQPGFHVHLRWNTIKTEQKIVRFCHVKNKTHLFKEKILNSQEKDTNKQHKQTKEKQRLENEMLRQAGTIVI
jgi:hypothetical protein